MREEVFVVGTVRNCSKKILRVVKQLEKQLSRAGRSAHFFLVESDSRDETVGRLEKIAKTRPNFQFVSLGELERKTPNRIARIAVCRNTYMYELEKLENAGRALTHVIVADFDKVNFKVRFPRIPERLFSQDVVFTANQFGRYYDILALRAHGWVDEDYRISMLRYLEKKLTKLAAFLEAVSKKQVHIPPSEEAIEVQSAFGGLAIYPWRAISGLRYEPDQVTDSILECEHVSFSRSIKFRNVKIFIEPSLRNKGDYRHSFSSNPFVYAALRVSSRTWGLLSKRK
jgi:hypothetical protein